MILKLTNVEIIKTSQINVLTGDTQIFKHFIKFHEKFMNDLARKIFKN